MSIEEIKQELRELREMRKKDVFYTMYPHLCTDSAVAKRQRALSDKLCSLGLGVTWCAEVHDYAVFCVEKENNANTKETSGEEDNAATQELSQ